MVYLSWLIKIAIFVLLLGFAIKNADMVTLYYWLNYEWRAPLVLVILVFLVIGIMIGLLAAFGTIFRQRRQIQALKKELKLQASTARAAADSAPVPVASTAPPPPGPSAADANSVPSI